MKLLTTRAVAGLFNVTPETIQRWIREGKLHAVRTLGGHYRVPLPEVNKHLREMGLPEIQEESDD